MKTKKIVIGCRQKNFSSLEKILNDDDIFKTSLLALCSDKFYKNIEVRLIVYQDKDKKND